MKVAGRRIGKPGDEGRGGVGRERSRAAVESDNGFVREVVANQAAGGDIPVLDRVGVGAGQIQGVVVNLGSSGGFEADAGSGVTTGGAIIGNEVILDLATGMD